MLGLKVGLAHAQVVKKYLMEHDLFDKNYAAKRENGIIVFPAVRHFDPPFDFDTEFRDGDLDSRQTAQSLRAVLYPLLTEEENRLLRASYDIVGSIAIIDVPEQLVAKEQLIGQKLLDNNKAVKTVLKKIGGHEGVYRTQRMACIAGEDTRETVVTENRIRLRVNVEATYYSIRMATERKRIAQQVKAGERVLCLFSGIGPYPITFSVHTEAIEIVGIEINPAAHGLAVENVAKNRCTNIRLLCGDAHEMIPKFAGHGMKFDRIAMPLPRTGEEFIDDVMVVAKSGTVLHFYAFLEEGKFNQAVPRLRLAAQRHGFELARYDVIRTGQQSPRMWRICVDAELMKV